MTARRRARFSKRSGLAVSTSPGEKRQSTVLGETKTQQRLSIAWCGLLLGAMVTTIAPRAHADEPVRTEVYDPGEYPPPSAPWGVFAVGLGSTLVWYGGAAGASYLWPDAPGAHDLRIPVAGPWLALGHTGCADNNPDCSTFSIIARLVGTALDGVGQVGGVALMAEALFLPTAVPSPTKRRATLHGRHAWRVRPAPLVTGKSGVGFGLMGEF